MSIQVGKADKAEKGDKAIASKLDKSKQTEIKEKLYNTKQVETSITILDSPEVDIVLEALLFISKYADLNKNNSVFLIKKGLIPKLTQNLSKNICILRLSLRLFTEVLNFEEALNEIDQEIYDETFLQITDMFIDHKDVHVRQYCIEILSKIAAMPRIAVLIFKIDLLSPVLENIKFSKNSTVQYYTLLLFFRLMDIPAAISAVPECNNYDPKKITSFKLSFLQDGFKTVHLVEKLLAIIMRDSREEQHEKAIQILLNCIQSEETSTYFIESIEFLELCQWIKTCHPKYLTPLIEVFLKLSSVPEIKQMLFDLSVEESVLYFFRYSNKFVINKTCQTVSNLTTHKYCCEQMLTPVIASTLLDILNRQNDEEDPYNEIALKTIFHFIRRYNRAIEIFMAKEFKPILLNYFLVKSKLIADESFAMVLEIIYRCLVHPLYQQEFISSELFVELLTLFKESTPSVSSLCCEILTSVLPTQDFRKCFLQKNGPKTFLNVMENCQDVELLTQILYFLFSSLVYEDVAMAFLHGGLIRSLRKFDEFLKSKIPLIKKVLNMALGYYLPIKFFEMGRLEVTEKLPNRFYLINGPWTAPFPFLDVLENIHVSPYQTIYVVDYSLEVVKENLPELKSQTSLLISKSYSKSFESSPSIKKSPENSNLTITSHDSGTFDINYGGISSDPYLPRYIYHIQKYEKYLQGDIQTRCRFLAEYIDTLLCGPKEHLTLPQKIHEYKLQIECLKNKLGNNIIPIGYLRLGFHCERALLFKALADKVSIPCSLVKGNLKIYWNEVAVFEGLDTDEKVKFYVVDLIEDLGNLMPVGSREANKYCNNN
ncbi:uncharacterized protein LOC115878252 [Sitophilus oryzae]|uniref:Uncharacterized protein LOC115878252 n=1 Tax=Sitophilus oryzae TaxID=7048 RepID=A0A6J2XHX9_SITOR|nr:uncharacterized protein LOC115878252 [Sitophilus oryzae]